MQVKKGKWLGQWRTNQSLLQLVVWCQQQDFLVGREGVNMLELKAVCDVLNPFLKILHMLLFPLQYHRYVRMKLILFMLMIFLWK